MVRCLLRFKKEIVDQPITSGIILEKKTPINILTARINQEGGEILAEIESGNAKEIIDAFRKKGVIVDLQNLIEIDKEKCIECGACYSLCPIQVISFKEDNSISFEIDRCLGLSCGLCVDTCPRRAIKMIG